MDLSTILSVVTIQRQINIQIYPLFLHESFLLPGFVVDQELHAVQTSFQMNFSAVGDNYALVMRNLTKGTVKAYAEIETYGAPRALLIKRNLEVEKGDTVEIDLKVEFKFSNNLSFFERVISKILGSAYATDEKIGNITFQGARVFNALFEDRDVKLYDGYQYPGTTSLGKESLQYFSYNVANDDYPQRQNRVIAKMDLSKWWNPFDDIFLIVQKYKRGKCSQEEGDIKLIKSSGPRFKNRRDEWVFDSNVHFDSAPFVCLKVAIGRNKVIDLKPTIDILEYSQVQRYWNETIDKRKRYFDLNHHSEIFPTLVPINTFRYRYTDQ